MSDSTKEMQKERNQAQKKAAETKDPEDWKLFRRLRNRCVTNLRNDRRKWETEKLKSSKNGPTQIWKTVKDIIKWNNSGPPSQLLHEGAIINTPKGLAPTLNNFL